jgi:hypothetical protein
MQESPIRLTAYSHGAGCGCKLSPAVLHGILSAVDRSERFPGLLVGNETKDDAAVVDLGDGTGIITTTDFFMPIVDDPRTFGRIAAANAISDIYAMGGTPLVAIAILALQMAAIAVGPSPTPASVLQLVALIALVITFLSATQDIVHLLPHKWNHFLVQARYGVDVRTRLAVEADARTTNAAVTMSATVMCSTTTTTTKV